MVGQPSRLTNVLVNDYVHTKDQPLEKGIDFKKFAQEADGLTGADIELICKKAALMTIRNAISKQITSSAELVITEKDFTHAIEEVKKR